MREGALKEPPGGEIVVGMGDCQVAGFPAASLATYALGSCLAVIAFDWKERRGGMLHVMLPDSSMDTARASTNPFLFVDTGVTELFSRLEKLGSPRKRLRCCVTGGASMMTGPSHFEIGKRNLLALKRTFWRLGVFIDREDVGGVESRSVRLDLATGRIDLRKGMGSGTILMPAAINLMGRTSKDAGIDR